MRSKDSTKRKMRGMRFTKTPAETDLFCPNCLSQVILYSFTISNTTAKVPEKKNFLCERCEKVSTRKNVLSFDDMVTEKFDRAKGLEKR